MPSDQCDLVVSPFSIIRPRRLLEMMLVRIQPVAPEHVWCEGKDLKGDAFPMRPVVTRLPKAGDSRFESCRVNSLSGPMKRVIESVDRRFESYQASR